MWNPGRWALAIVIAVLAVMFGAPATAHADDTFADLCARVSDEAAGSRVKMGIVVIDLATDARCDVNADDTFRTASLYKLVVLAEAYRQAAEGTFDFSAPIDLEPRHAIDDPPSFQLTETITIGRTEALGRMIRLSDNASAAALRERLGYAEVAAEPARLGMQHTELSETAFVSTPSDIAQLVTNLYRGTVVDAASSEAMMDLLKQQGVTDLIPVGLPDGTVIAHKTGTLDTVLHDVGVVYAPAGDYVLVAMTQHESDYPAAARAIQELSRTVYAAYGGTTPPYAVNERLEQRVAATRLINVIPVELLQTAPAEALVAAPAAAIAPAAEPPFIESSGSPFGRLDAPVVPAVALAMLLLTPAMVFAARTWNARRGRRPVFAEVESRLIPAGRSPQMRFGNRREQDDQYDQYEEEQPVTRAAATTEMGAPAMLPSRRLQRVGELFRTHAELLDQMRAQFQDELQPLNELLARQAATMQQLLLNLEQRLRPLNEYADSEESNLESLERRMRESGSDFVTRSFSEYVLQQRKRIAETRQQIDQQRTPFSQYGEDQRDAVEVALARFDEDVENLELNLADQRKVMMRMLDSMRSESFAAVKEYLQNREEVMSELATSGMTDPSEIGRSVQALRQSIEAMAQESAHIQSVLQTTDEADRRLSRTVAGSTAGPRPLPSQTRQTASVAVSANDEEASA